MQLTFDKLLEARKRLLRMHFESGVGHIGGNLSALDAMLLLFHEFIGDNDSFILSKGHAAGALYVALWSKGRIEDHELETFHKDGTRLAGHPPATGGIGEISFATGSLGHGLSLAAGTALARRLGGHPGHTYCMTSDGEWQEGSTWEALIFLNHHRLCNLTVLIDNNRLQGFGETRKVASMSPLEDRLRGFDVEVENVPGHDLNVIRDALSRPRVADDPKTRFLILDSVKGHGVSFMENKMEWHYLAMTDDMFKQAFTELDGVK
jgi:transketolase